MKLFSRPPEKTAEAPQLNDRVRVSAKALIGLSQAARSLTLRPGAIRSEQAGNHLSAFKGRGMEFDEVRPYQPGDDLRTIDWRVTARTGRTHTKLFCEERERPVLLWVDYRAPMFFATRGAFKSVVAAQAAALLGWRAVQAGDHLGGLVFSEDRHLELRPQQGKNAVLHFIRQLAEHPAWEHKTQESSQAPAALWNLARLRRAARPGSKIFLISDFRNLAPQAEANIGLLARHNDLVLVFIHDPLEAQLPPAGRYKVAGEKQELVLDTANAQACHQYRQRFAQRRIQLQELCRKHRMLLLPCATDQDPATALRTGLMGKKR